MMILIVPVVLIAAIVLLVGLPLGTVWIMNSSDCCLASDPESAVSFWASMVGGFLALFGMIITGVFIITAFRVDATARDKAQVAAQEEVWKYIDHYEERLAQDLMDLKVLAKEMLVEVKISGENAKKDIEAQRKEASSAIVAARDATIADIEAQQREASRAIVAARDATTNAASQAQGGIAKALNETTSAATEAQEAVGRAGQEVDRQRDEAIRAIDGARQEVEAAAKEVRERADRGVEGPTPTEGDDPEQRDE